MMIVFAFAAFLSCAITGFLMWPYGIWLTLLVMPVVASITVLITAVAMAFLRPAREGATIRRGTGFVANALSRLRLR